MEYESYGDINCNCYAGHSHQRIDNGSGGLGNKRTSGGYLNDRIIKIGQNTEKSPGNLSRLAVTQKPMKDHRLMLVRKTFKGIITIMIIIIITCLNFRVKSLMIFIIQGFRTTVFILIVIFTTFRPICPPAFFRCLSNSGTYMELQTTSFI